jgi:hypothetical protein
MAKPCDPRRTSIADGGLDTAQSRWEGRAKSEVLYSGPVTQENCLFDLQRQKTDREEVQKRV